MGRTDFVASAAYQPEPTAVAAARRFVRDTLAEWLAARADGHGHGLVDDAVLLTSELVTNAVVHARTTVQVICRLAEDEVEVAVSDGDPGRMVPEPQRQEPASAEGTSGRGLLLPASLASAWGVTYGHAAKAVWFRLGLAGEAGLGNGAADGGASVSAAGQGGAAADRAALSAALQRAPGAHAQLAQDRLPEDGLAQEGLAPDAAARASAGAESASRAHGPAPDGGGYQALLASAVESARELVGADAAYALMADEDGELVLGAAVGSMPGADPRPGAPPGPARPRLAAAEALASPAPSVVTAPFLVGGRVTGLLAAACAAPGRFAGDEAAALQQVADRCGPALEQARIADLERVRRSRISALAMARDLLVGDLDRDGAVSLAARAAVPRLADWCAVLLPQDGALRREIAWHADSEQTSALAWLLDQSCAAGGPASGWARPAPPVDLPGAGGPIWRWPLGGGDMAGAPARARALAGDDACCFPLGPARRAGVLAVGCPRQARLPREVAELAADLACRLGVALSAGHVPGRKQPGRRSARSSSASAARTAAR